jgi:hypothetical protein
VLKEHSSEATAELDIALYVLTVIASDDLCKVASRLF